jgi:thiosulfate/3-mercaptopyruvate sulfurtransferase
MLRYSTGCAVTIVAGVLFGNALPYAELRAEEQGKTGVRKAEHPPAQLLSFDDLEKRLKEPNLRLLDCRPRADYEKGHLPSAVWVDTKALESQAGRPGGLDDRKFWEDWAATLGIDSKSAVFVYDAKRQLDAARVWFFLRWIGVENVGLINGGYALWTRQNRPVATAIPKVESHPFKVEFRKDVAATRDEVLAAVKADSANVLDARSDAEFAGTDRKSKRGGHIPTACHLEWTNLVDEDGKFLDHDALQTKVEKSGINLGSDVICHCQGGGRASVNAFALELLGLRTRNYYLGWSDWGNAEATPVVEGSASGKK